VPTILTSPETQTPQNKLRSRLFVCLFVVCLFVVCLCGGWDVCGLFVCLFVCLFVVCLFVVCLCLVCLFVVCLVCLFVVCLFVCTGTRSLQLSANRESARPHITFTSCSPDDHGYPVRPFLHPMMPFFSEIQISKMTRLGSRSAARRGTITTWRRGGLALISIPH
jgi:hypothetical protein